MKSASEPKHPIQVVSRRTGLTADVIRVWERRYAAVTPRRSATNRRLYSEEDLERLLLLRRATLNGRAIGHVAGLRTAELRALVDADEAAERNAPAARTEEPTPAGARLSGCLDAVKRLDASRLRSMLRAAAFEMGVPTFLEDLLVPLLTRLGEDWRHGAVGIHHEHMASSIIRALLESLREANGAGFGGPAVVVSTPPGETHELGALMAAVIAAAEGCRVTYLGSNLPLDDIAAAARAVEARAVALSLVHGEREPSLAEGLLRLRDRLDAETEIFVGGAAARRYADILRRIGAKAPETLERFRAELARLANSTE